MLRTIRFTRKRVRTRTVDYYSRDNIKGRKEIVIELLKYITNGLEIIFLDEAGFSANSAPLYGYSKIGRPCCLRVKRKTKNITMISAISRNKIYGIQFFEGGVTASDYGAFICNLLKNNSGLIPNRHKFVLYMDNAPIHKARLLRPLYNHLNIVFGAAYSPYLNAIEEFFSTVKYFFRRTIFHEHDVIRAILLSLKRLKQSSLEGYYLHILDFMEDCLNLCESC